MLAPFTPYPVDMPVFETPVYVDLMRTFSQNPVSPLSQLRIRGRISCQVQQKSSLMQIVRQTNMNRLSYLYLGFILSMRPIRVISAPSSLMVGNFPPDPVVYLKIQSPSKSLPGSIVIEGGNFSPGFKIRSECSSNVIVLF